MQNLKTTCKTPWGNLTNKSQKMWKPKSKLNNTQQRQMTTHWENTTEIETRKNAKFEKHPQLKQTTYKHANNENKPAQTTRHHNKHLRANNNK